MATDMTDADDLTYRREKLARLDEATPGWRDLRLPNGLPQFSLDGTMLDETGNRSIFDDIDE